MLNPKLVHDFKLYLESEKKKSESSYVNRYANVGTTIFFYEWSDISNGAKCYEDKEVFLKFCKDSNIIIDEFDLRLINYGRVLYCTCKPNTSVLVTGYTYYGLSTSLKNFEVKAVVPSS